LAAVTDSRLAADVAGCGWYHTLELPGGVVTPGMYDLRSVVDRVLPDDLTGLRCLDAATANGFWAFEMEKRGAREVVGIDLEKDDERDWQKPWLAPSGDLRTVDGFELAREALGSAVSRVNCSLYDVSPDRVGSFDFVFLGSVLLHLRDPVRALRALATVTAGEFLSLEVHLWWASKLLPHTPVGRLAVQDDSRWWTPNSAAHARWLEAAGFDIVNRSGVLKQPFGPGGPTTLPWQQLLRRPRSLGAQAQAIAGVPSGWLRARPRH
jgi:tRNA (mo5U34)-methyltransferase